MHYPLSFSQNRLWFLEKFDPGKSTYHVYGRFHLYGSLSIPAFEQAIRIIVERHAALRTAFVEEEGIPAQLIAQSVNIPFQLTDLRPYSESEQVALAHAIRQHCQETPFDLTNPPLFRLQLIQTKDEQFELLLVMHHIITDGWSREIFYRELSEAYTAVLKNSAPALPALTTNYGEYAMQQQQKLENGTWEPQISYWKAQLAQAPQLLSLPTDYPRPNVQTFNGAKFAVHISDLLFQQVKKFSNAHQLTPFTVLMAAFQLLLHRYSGEHDILVGTSVANRTDIAHEKIMGFFVNNVVIRTLFDKDATVLDLIQAVQKTSFAAFSNQDVPIEKVVEDVADRTVGHSAVFQTMFILQPERKEALSLPDILVEFADTDGIASAVDLTLSLHQSDTQLKGYAEFNTDLFKTERIERMMMHFEQLLNGMTTFPNRSFRSISLLPSIEKQQLLGAWNNTAVSFPPFSTLNQLFEHQTNQTPHNTSIEHQMDAISYAQLNSQANQLARYLKASGVEAGAHMGLHLERSIEQITAFFAILKAGATVVPLDPSYPLERLAYYAEDSELTAVLTHSKLTSPLSANSQASQIFIDRSEAWRNLPADNLDIAIASDSLAAIYYTSGSTGTPKGVMLTHQNLIHYAQSGAKQFKLTSSDRMLQFATIGFDTFIEEVFTTLTCGGTLVLRTEQLLDSLPKFISFLNQTRVSVISLPTAFWHHLTESIADLTLPDSLRLVIIGGERALPDRLTQWQAYVPNAIQLINSYGPTEVSVVSTMAFLETAVVPHGAECPIGTPIPNAQVLVLDDHGQPVPIGVAGELYIGGKGVAKGYWQQPEKTSHAFIQLPRKLTRYLQQPSSTFYKTGDLVQWEANGALTFVGRRDNQIKIRGVRIEPSEIELCLRAHTAVSDAIVQPYTQANGETQLIAYLILQTPIADSLLKAHIGETMLAQMVPSQFCKLDAWPLLPNGKVDVASLPKPNLAPVSETVEFAAPQTATEKTLCTIWASCLNIPTIGITTNFFDVGGHSLLAMKLVTQIETQLNHPLSVRQLFEYPTIHQLGQVIDSLNAISKVAQTVQSEQQPTNAELLFEEGEL